MLDELARSGYQPTAERVESIAALGTALVRRRWDVVLCGDLSGQPTAAAVRRVVHEVPAVPVIVVSQAARPEDVVAALQEGARDYVAKNNLSRLGAAIARALSAEERQPPSRPESRPQGTGLQQQQALPESDERFGSAFRHAPIGMALVDLSGRPFQVNRAYCEMLGYSEEEMLAKSLVELTHPDDRTNQSDYGRHLLAGHVRTFEYQKRYLHKSGRPVWAHVSVSLVRDADGAPRYMIAQAEDVTERKRAEDEKSALLEVARDLGGTLQLADILDHAQRHAAAVLPCDRVVTYDWDADRQRFRIKAHYGIPEHLLATAVEVEYGPREPFMTWISSGKTLIVNDVTRQYWLPTDLLAQANVSALVAVPFLVRGVMAGLMMALRCGDSPGFDEREVQLFEGIARQVAIAVQAAEAYRVQEEAAQFSAALARVGRELISSLDQPVLLSRLCHLTTEVLGCDFSHTFLWDEQEEAYAAVSSYGDPVEHWESIRVLRIPRSLVSGLIARLEQADVAQVVVSEPQTLVPAPLPMKYGITVGLYVALRRGGHLFGILTAGFRGRSEPFSSLQVRTAAGIGQLASMALANARLMEQMEASNRLKSDFVATMSHELRTPLNAIMGYDDLLLDGGFGPVPADQADILKRIGRSAHQLLELINATLDLSRLESGRLSIERAPVAVPDLLRALAEEMADAPSKPGVTLCWNVPAVLPRLYTDPVKVKVIVKNLIANALKFTDHGTVEVAARAGDGGVQISVRDTGIGINAEILPIIFEAFRQADSSSTRRYAGVGLGLYIVRRLLDMLGGTISVETAESRGSTFSIWLPTDSPADERNT